ncbi:MAG TPA: thiamine phosphate synthase, partial [Mycobacterium sp.]
MHERLASARLYLCTDARRDRDDLAEFADAALAGGVDIIQLRDKGSTGEQQLGPLEARDELAALEILADAARRHGALVAVNDRA